MVACKLEHVVREQRTLNITLHFQLTFEAWLFALSVKMMCLQA